MPALLKFLVPLAIFLLASNAHAFTSLSSVPGIQVWVNHLTQLQQPMSDPTNEPSLEPRCEPTNDQMVNDQTTNQRLEWDAELPNILPPKRGKYSLSQKQDAELPSKIAISITQITSDTSYKFEAVNNVDSLRVILDHFVPHRGYHDHPIGKGQNNKVSMYLPVFPSPKVSVLISVQD